MFCLAVVEKIVCFNTGPKRKYGTCVTHSYCVVIAVDQVFRIEIEQCFSFEYLATS